MIGLGYRKDFARHFLDNETLDIDFVEVAPENWYNMGGYWKKKFDQVLEKYPLYTHGLSLSIGSPDPLDFDFLKNIKKFLDQTGAKLYSEHLSYSQVDNAHLYDLLPIPFTTDAVKHIVERIKTVQDFLERPLVLEQASYYTPIAAEMSELEFINQIILESGCKMLLDVNNVYVNAFNHKYDAKNFIEGLPLDKVAYIHMAGHTQVAEDLIIDTHGQDIIDPVYDLYDFATKKLNRKIPTLLERDFNIPSLDTLSKEVHNIRSIQTKALEKISV